MEEILSCIDTHFVHEYSNGFHLDIFAFVKRLILLTIINKSAQDTIKTIRISYKQQAPNSGAITGFYFNPLLYPVSVIN